MKASDPARATRFLDTVWPVAQKAADFVQGIAAAIFRDPSIAPCPGAWDSFRSYFVRGVWPDCSLDQRVDSSTDLLWVFGLLDAKDPRATEHRRAMLALLNQLGLFDPRLP